MHGQGGAKRPGLGDGRRGLYSLVCANVLHVEDEVYISTGYVDVRKKGAMGEEDSQVRCKAYPNFTKL